jgi:hypothetical protein
MIKVCMILEKEWLLSNYIIYAKLSLDAYSLIIFFIKMYIIEIWQKVMASSWQVDVRLFFILAARIAFWVFVHCILGLSVD